MLGPLLALGGVAFLTSCNSAPVFAVNTTLDGRDADPADGVCEMTVGLGDCSLRAAVDQSNATAVPVTIAIPSGTYVLAAGAADDTNAAGDLDVNTSPHGVIFRADSPGARIDAGGNEAAMDVRGGLVQLDHVSFTNAAGPGVHVHGGLFAMRWSASVDNSGPGLAVAAGATATVQDSTLSGNGAGGADIAGTLSASSVTVTANTGGGLRGTGPKTLAADLIADQASGADCTGPVTTSGYSADSDGTCGLHGTGDTTAPDAALAPLSADLVPFHRPQPGSIARDAIPAGTRCDGTGVDQTGTTRPVGPACDRGAIEADFAAPPTANPDNRTVTARAGATPVPVLANDVDPNPHDALRITAVDLTGTAGLVTNDASSVSYDPNGAFDGLHHDETATDTFTYTVTDADGGTSTATVIMTITGVDPPGTPTGVVAMNAAGLPGSVYLQWFDPYDDGGSPIVDHRVDYSDDGGASWTSAGSVGPTQNVNVPGFTGGVAYRLRVTAENAAGLGPVSAASNAVTIPGTGTPDAPADVTVTPNLSPRSLDVSWSASDGHGGAIAYYVVEVSNDAGATYNPISIVTSTTATVCCWDLGDTTQFRVSATNNLGPGANGYSAPYIVFADAPTNVTASIGADPSWIDLTWTAPAATTWPVQSYGIETSTDGGSTWSSPIYPGGTGTSTSLCCYSVGQSVRWRVTAFTGGGSSAATSSNTVSIVVGAPTAVTAAPGATPPDVDLSWTAPVAPAWPVTSYAIESSTDDGATWNAVSTTTSPATTATVCCAVGGSSTVWRVIAITDAGAGAPSDPSNAIDQHVDAPTGVVATLDPAPLYVDLTWTAPASSAWPVTSYKVEASFDGGTTWYEFGTTTGPTTTWSGCCFGYGTPLNWAVTANTATGSSARSAMSNTINLYVDPPTDVVASPGASPESVDLTWTAGAADWPITGYFIEQSTDAGATWTYLTYTTGTTPSTTVCCLAPGTYQLRVTTMTDAGWSATGAVSNEFTIP